jgi:tyrosyl-tRNA synthetase
MSSSDPDSKIDLLDPPEVVKQKIRRAVAAPRVIEGNGLLAFVEFVLLPVAALNGRREFRVERDRDGLEPLIYTSIHQMHEDYVNDIVSRMSYFCSVVLFLTVFQLTPQLLKPAVTTALNKLLAPIQAAYQSSTDWQEITLKAYPPPEKKEKKEKKVKKMGTRHPRANNAEVNNVKANNVEAKNAEA